MVKQLFLLAILVLVFWSKPVLAARLCNPIDCPGLYPTMTPTPTITPTPTLTPTPVPTPTPEINLANYHPVILIHGLGGVPQDWHMADQNYVKLLEDLGYPADYIKEYVYADSDGDPTTYDYQGDIVKISANMKNDVETLSEKSFANHGDGKVDLVGYSLGGLVAREYLHENPADNKIRKLITVGTPHLGVFWLEAEKWPEILPQIGGLAREVMNTFLNSILWQVKKFQPIDLSSDAAQEVRPDSLFLADLNNLTMIVHHPNYYTFYGDIDAAIRFQVFIYKMEIKASLGDLFILPGSAAGIPVQYPPISRYSFSDKAIFALGVENNDGGFGYSIDWLTANDSKYDHTSLLKQNEIQSTIVSILNS